MFKLPDAKSTLSKRAYWFSQFALTTFVAGGISIVMLQSSEADANLSVAQCITIAEQLVARNPNNQTFVDEAREMAEIQYKSWLSKNLGSNEDYINQMADNMRVASFQFEREDITVDEYQAAWVNICVNK